jgi:hypothetical protein
MIAKAQMVIDEMVIDEINRTIEALRSAAKTELPAWQRWLLDAAYR